ncbi:hypothetical protein ACQ4M3_23420 [Leptolyngbya sp. AN03gr2]|uniref:hypothetical protein n=1 Tax=unclassified Leptolyngbya TaxID=2650499 RepID=UPI003D31B2CF
MDGFEVEFQHFPIGKLDAVGMRFFTIGLVKGENDDRLNSQEELLVQPRKVEENPSGEVRLWGRLGFEMENENGIFAQLFHFNEQIDDLVFPSRKVCKVLLLEKANGVGVNGGSHLWQEEFEKLQKKCRDEFLE